MAIRKNRVGCQLVTLVAGVGTVTWQDPDTYLGTAPVQIELDYAPDFVWCELVTVGGLLGSMPIASSITAAGGTITSNWPGGAPGDTMVGDTSTYRVYAVCRKEDL